MVRTYHITIVSIVAMTLFVLLIYPAIVPVNAPPVLKTFKDLFHALGVLAFVALFTLTALVNAAYAEWEDPYPGEVDGICLLLCTRRC